jgi:glycosyltransferase involved in cell wall biosynthesis
VYNEMLRPALSIIIPFHNAESTIIDTLKSLQGQTFKGWEAIVVDDGSTDASYSIVKDFATGEARLKTIRQKKAGVSAARNKGIEFSQGKYLNFLDADDLLVPTMLSKMIGELEGKDQDAVCCGWTLADRNLQNLNWHCTPPKERDLFPRLAHENLFPLHCGIVSRSVVESVGAFDPTLNQCEDWDLWVRISRTGVKFASILDPLVIYRMQPVSNSRNAQANFLAGRQVIDRAHSVDSRIKDASKDLYYGCGCKNHEEALLEWLLVCIAFAIVKGDPSEINKLSAKIPTIHGGDLSPSLTRSMGYALWFGSAIPHGDWESFSRRIGEPLLDFLSAEERRMGVPGFALQSLLEITGWHGLERKTQALTAELSHFETIDGIRLLRALGRKAVNRLTRVVPRPLIALIQKAGR